MTNVDQYLQILYVLKWKSAQPQFNTTTDWREDSTTEPLPAPKAAHRNVINPTNLPQHIYIALLKQQWLLLVVIV